MGVTDQRETNQIANYALLEWGDNSKIGAADPAEYVPLMLVPLKPDEVVRQYRWHALPDGWEAMPYRAFFGGSARAHCSLRRRRVPPPQRGKRARGN